MRLSTIPRCPDAKSAAVFSTNSASTSKGAPFKRSCSSLSRTFSMSGNGRKGEWGEGGQKERMKGGEEERERETRTSC